MKYPNMVGIPKDYSDKANWMVLPKRPAKPKKDVDCIWLYPTSCMSKDTIGDVNTVMKLMAKSNYKQNGPVFRKHCNMYAPYYRQFSATKFNDFTDDEIFDVEAREPRTDVYAALDYYFENYNNGRPYVLAGHSQGSCLIVYVLTEYMKLHPEYYDRMVAAYVVGYGLTPEQLAANPHIKPAEGAEDTGVLLSWNTEGPENVDQHSFVIRPGAYLINPLNWKTDDTYAAADKKNKALADAQIDLARRSVVARSADPGKYALQNELLLKMGPLARLKKMQKMAENMMVPGFGTQSYHNQDYVFYADSVSENLALRIRKYQRAHK